jgi:hypothetical protein
MAHNPANSSYALLLNPFVYSRSSLRDMIPKQPQPGQKASSMLSFLMTKDPSIGTVPYTNSSPLPTVFWTDAIKGWGILLSTMDEAFFHKAWPRESSNHGVTTWLWQRQARR